MIEAKDLEDLHSAMNKSKDEFDIAAALLAKALTDVHERLERIEKWITENQKNPSPQE